jgi:hypothetical protein
MITDLEVTGTFAVNEKYSATITFGPHPQGMRCEWTPDVPVRGQLSAKDLKRYQRERNKIAAEYSKAIGGGVLVIDA